MWNLNWQQNCNMPVLEIFFGIYVQWKFSVTSMAVVRCQFELPYFSIDNAHLMYTAHLVYNTHPKLFTLYFYLSFVITFDLPLIPF